MDTREVVERYDETVNAGDCDTWLTVFDEHVVVDEQLAGHMEGVVAMRQEADALRTTYPKFRGAFAPASQPAAQPASQAPFQSRAGHERGNGSGSKGPAALRPAGCRWRFRGRMAVASPAR
jgi:hypothetical protein